jgi:hypothetical protein
MPLVFEVVMTPLPPGGLGLGLTLAGETLPTAYWGIPYSQFIAFQASGGIAPLTFSQLADVGNGVYATSGAGTISGIPYVPAIQVTDANEYIIDEQGNLLIT